MELRWQSEWTKPTVIGVVSFGVGAAVGYWVSERQSRLARQVLDNLRDALSDEEVEDELHLDLDWQNVNAETFDQIIEDIQNVPENVEIRDGVAYEVETITLETDDVEIVDYRRVNAFPDNLPDWDYDVEIAQRTVDAPYIIHYDEFFHEEAGYTQCTLTYYRGDDVLLDDHDVPLYNAKMVVGEGNYQFGKGSQDPSIVYIRNDKLEAEYEVILDTGYYQVEVLGEELEHSFERKPPLHKFRD